MVTVIPSTFDSRPPADPPDASRAIAINFLRRPLP
jgi:hypothetical protein